MPGVIKHQAMGMEIQDRNRAAILRDESKQVLSGCLEFLSP